MSACCSLRSRSPLKTVFGKIGDTYKANCHTYKMLTMATQHGGSGQHLDRDITAHKTTDTEIEHAQELHHDFEDSDTYNPTRLTAITRGLDDLCQCVQAGEGQPSEALNCTDCKLQRLFISIHPSAPLEPLEEVLKHYMDTLCSAQKQTNFTTSLLQDILIFTGHDTMLLKDWLMDIETVIDLTSESRTKLSQAKSKALIHTLIAEAITSGKS